MPDRRRSITSVKTSSTPPTSVSSRGRQVYCANPHRNGEDLENYQPGGLLPVVVGQKFIGSRHTYEIIHRLGYGGSSTVWVARTSDGLFSMKFVSERRSKDATEESNARLICGRSELVSCVAQLVEVFTFVRRDGGARSTHKVLVFGLLGPSIARLSSGCTRLHPQIARGVLRKTADALAKLHSAGFVHRDLTPRNVLLTLKSSVSSATTTAFYGQYGEPCKYPVERYDKKPVEPHAPKFCYEAVDLALQAGNIVPEPVLIDFGESGSADRVPTRRLGIPARYAAPEAILENTATKSSDVWSLGCIIYKARCGYDLFCADSPMDAIFEMIHILGPPKMAWQKITYNHSGYVVTPSVGGVQEKHFDLRGICQTPHPEYKSSLQQKVSEIPDRPRHYPSNKIWWGTGDECDDDDRHTYPRISPNEAASLVDLLSKIFKWEASERITATEVMEHPWFRGH